MKGWTSLGAAEGGHVFGFFAGNTPVVGLVDGFVMFPGGFVVNGKPLDGLGGQSLQEPKQQVIMNGIQSGVKKKTNQPLLFQKKKSYSCG